MSSGTTGSTAVQPSVRSSHPQNFLHIILNVYVFKFCLASEVCTDEVLSFDGVVSHVELHDLCNRLLVAELHSVKSHVLADELDELVCRDLSETFESCDLHSALHLLEHLLLLLPCVAVADIRLVLDSEERSLKDVYVSSSHKVRVVLHEECQHKHADVHSVVIGIGCDDDLVVSEILHIIFHAKGIHQECELLVFRNLLAALLVAVDRLTSEAEHSLGLCVACLCDGSARRVSLGDEDAGVFGQFLLSCRELVVVVDLAIAQLAVIDVGSLVCFLCLLLDRRDLLALLFRLGDLMLKQ